MSQPQDIVEHYRKLFEGAGLPFHPNSDGLGTSIRAEARECGLLIQIRSQSEGALVNVNCAAKTEAASPASPSSPTDNEKDSIGSAPAEEWLGATEWLAGALRIEFIERSRDESLGIELPFRC